MADLAELKACPNPECRNTKPEVWNCADEACHVICFECGAAGPYGKTTEDATRLWNALPRTDYAELAKQLAEALEDCLEGLDDEGHSEKESECPWCTAYAKGGVALAAAKSAGVIA